MTRSALLVAGVCLSLLAGTAGAQDMARACVTVDSKRKPDYYWINSCGVRLIVWYRHGNGCSTGCQSHVPANGEQLFVSPRGTPMGYGACMYPDIPKVSGGRITCN